jgi:integrase/recombinase XerD
MTAFSQHVADYLRLRRSFGCKLDEAARVLPRFAARLEAAGAEFVTIDLALAWALEQEVPPGSVVPSVRMLVARGFARYMAGVDRRTEIPPAGLVAFRRRRRAPFIYSDADIVALMNQARCSIREPLRAATYEALIGLLVASGLRIGEAIKLDRGDIDWTDGVLWSASRSSTSRATCRCTTVPSRRSRATRAGATSCAPRRTTRASSCRCTGRG